MKINSVLIAFTAIFLTLFMITIALGYALDLGFYPFGVSKVSILTFRQNVSDLLILASFLGLSLSLMKIVKEPSRDMRIMCAVMAIAYFTYNYAQTFLGNDFIAYLAVFAIVVTTFIVIFFSKNETS